MQNVFGEKKMKKEFKTIILGVTGGISAYKSVELGRALKKKGFEVITVLTTSAKEFVSSLTFKAAVGEVYTELFDKKRPMQHIALAKKADAIVIAPATANTIAKIASGSSDDLLTAIVLAANVPLIIAPAMNQGMYSNAITRRNLAFLKKQGAVIVEPEKGELACGDFGKGRLAAADKIVEEVEASICEKDLLGKKILITAGPTREFLDPVRFISTGSSGKMGFELAKKAAGRGAQVVLVAGPNSLEAPINAKVEEVVSAKEMLECVLKHFTNSDAFISAAAVCDFTPAKRQKQKIKKTPAFSLSLIQSPDVLLEAGKRKKNQVIIGFALETESGVENALKKLLKKNLDLIVLNDETALYGDSSKCTLLTADKATRLPMQEKSKTASRILDELAGML